MHEILPILDSHLLKLGVELEALTFQWFLSIFTDCLAAEALFRVWDVILCLVGSPFLFQVALALLKLNEKALLDCNSAAGVYSYLNGEMTHQGISIDGLIRESDAMRGMVKKVDVERRREKAVKRELADMAVGEEEEEAARMEASLILEASTVAAATVISPEVEEVVGKIGGAQMPAAAAVASAVEEIPKSDAQETDPIRITANSSAEDITNGVAATSGNAQEPISAITVGAAEGTVEEAAETNDNFSEEASPETNPVAVIIEGTSNEKAATGKLQLGVSLSPITEDKQESTEASPLSLPQPTATMTTVISAV